MRKSIGKITGVRFGKCGYDDAGFGISISVETQDGCATHELWVWSSPPSKDAKWTVFDQDKKLVEISRYVMQLIKDAKVNSVEKLRGVPVEAIWEGQVIIDVRILTEVIL